MNENLVTRVMANNETVTYICWERGNHFSRMQRHWVNPSRTGLCSGAADKDKIIATVICLCLPLFGSV